MTDIFTKYAAARPFEGKKPENLMEPFRAALGDMGGKPEMFYTDNEGAFSSKVFQALRRARHRAPDHEHPRRRGRAADPHHQELRVQQDEA